MVYVGAPQAAAFPNSALGLVVIQTVLIAIPGLAALIVCIVSGPESACLNIYLPVLLLLPQSYGWPVSGQLTFADTAILPIGLFLLVRSKWQWNTIDFLVIAYMAITVVAEGMNKGYKLGSSKSGSAGVVLTSSALYRRQACFSERRARD